MPKKVVGSYQPEREREQIQSQLGRSERQSLLERTRALGAEIENTVTRATGASVEKATLKRQAQAIIDAPASQHLLKQNFGYSSALVSYKLAPGKPSTEVLRTLLAQLHRSLSREPEGYRYIQLQTTSGTETVRMFDLLELILALRGAKERKDAAIQKRTELKAQFKELQSRAKKLEQSLQSTLKTVSSENFAFGNVTRAQLEAIVHTLNGELDGAVKADEHRSDPDGYRLLLDTRDYYLTLYEIKMATVGAEIADTAELQAHVQDAEAQLRNLKRLDKVEQALNVWCSVYSFSFDLLLSLGGTIRGNFGEAETRASSSGSKSALKTVGSFAGRLVIGDVPKQLRLSRAYDTGSVGLSLKVGLSFGADVLGGVSAKLGLALLYNAGINVQDDRLFRSVSSISVVATAEASIPKALKLALSAELYHTKTVHVFLDHYHWAAWLAQKWARLVAKIRACDLYDSNTLDHPTDEDLSRIQRLAEQFLEHDPKLRALMAETEAYLKSPVTVVHDKRFFGSVKAEAALADGLVSVAAEKQMETTVTYQRRKKLSGRTGASAYYEEQTSSKASSWSVGGALFGVGVTLTRASFAEHPVPDNDGEYLNVKPAKANLGSGGLTIKPSSAATGSTAPDWATPLVNATSALSDALSGPSDFFTGVGMVTGDTALESAHMGSFQSVSRQINLGDIELNFVRASTTLPNQKTRDEWVLQYWRWIFTSGTSLSASFPVGYGLNVDLGAAFSLSRTYCESLGCNTLSYLQTVYDGLRKLPNEGPRPEELRSERLWRRYVEAHQHEIGYMLAALSERDGSRQTNIAREVMQSSLAEAKALLQQTSPGKLSIANLDKHTPFSREWKKCVRSAMKDKTLFDRLLGSLEKFMAAVDADTKRARDAKWKEVPGSNAFVDSKAKQKELGLEGMWAFLQEQCDVIQFPLPDNSRPAGPRRLSTAKPTPQESSRPSSLSDRPAGPLHRSASLPVRSGGSPPRPHVPENNLSQAERLRRIQEQLQSLNGRQDLEPALGQLIALARADAPDFVEMNRLVMVLRDRTDAHHPGRVRINQIWDGVQQILERGQLRALLDTVRGKQIIDCGAEGNCGPFSLAKGIHSQRNGGKTFDVFKQEYNAQLRSTIKDYLKAHKAYFIQEAPFDRVWSALTEAYQSGQEVERIAGNVRGWIAGDRKPVRTADREAAVEAYADYCSGDGIYVDQPFMEAVAQHYLGGGLQGVDIRMVAIYRQPAMDGNFQLVARYPVDAPIPADPTRQVLHLHYVGRHFQYIAMERAQQRVPVFPTTSASKNRFQMN